LRKINKIIKIGESVGKSYRGLEVRGLMSSHNLLGTIQTNEALISYGSRINFRTKKGKSIIMTVSAYIPPSEQNISGYAVLMVEEDYKRDLATIREFTPKEED